MTLNKKQRKNLLEKYRGIYSPYTFDVYPQSFGCFYCADIASTRDHCPPIAWVESRTTTDWLKVVQLQTG